MRILLSADMEGIAGVVGPEDVLPGSSEYERCRRLLTEEVNAAVRGVYETDMDAEVLVSEAHAGFRNLLPERLDRRATLLRGKPKPDGMMAGLAENTDAVLFIGYHGKAGTPRSVMPHTIRSGVIADVRCNGHSLGELGLNAALAVQRGAVAVLVSGDDTVAAEAAALAPGIAHGRGETCSRCPRRRPAAPRGSMRDARTGGAFRASRSRDCQITEVRRSCAAGS
jgi:D-amino peptidase